jgi:Ca2+-binding EF-hand superfamily protein
LEELFGAWDAGKKGFIDVESLKNKVIHIGATEVMLFAQFAEMDTNHDGQVSKDELFGYFQMVSGYVNDHEFAAVVDDMIGVASTNQAVKDLLAQLASVTYTGKRTS